MNEQKTFLCQRCREETSIDKKKLIMFWDHYEDEKSTATAKWLCADCYDMVYYASSPESWESSTKAFESVRRYYFDKQ